jgi:DNA polymerase sigma
MQTALFRASSFRWFVHPDATCALTQLLQAMEPTYALDVDGTECAYCDEVHQLHDFSAENKESIAKLLWEFFHYWAFHHDYRNDVISVRLGKTIT